VEQFVISTPDLDSTRFLNRMRGTAAGLTGRVAVDDIRLYQQWIANALRAFGRLQQGHIAERETEMWRLLDTYARAMHTNSTCENRLVDQIRGAHDRMRESMTLPDLREARTVIENELQQVQRVVTQRSRDEKERVTALAREVSRLEASLASLRGRANYDALTGVYHRAIADDRLRGLLAEGKPVCLALMDIDNFRTINTTLGQVVGDKILAVMGEQLQRVARTTDLPARYGGDEFCFVSNGGTLEQLAQRLAGAVGRRHIRMELDDRVCSVLLSVSVGMSISSPGDTLETVVSRATRAMDSVKADGKGGMRAA